MLFQTIKIPNDASSILTYICLYYLVLKEKKKEWRENYVQDLDICLSFKQIVHFQPGDLSKPGLIWLFITNCLVKPTFVTCKLLSVVSYSFRSTTSYVFGLVACSKLFALDFDHVSFLLLSSSYHLWRCYFQ